MQGALNITPYYQFMMGTEVFVGLVGIMQDVDERHGLLVKNFRKAPGSTVSRYDCVFWAQLYLGEKRLVL